MLRRLMPAYTVSGQQDRVSKTPIGARPPRFFFGYESAESLPVCAVAIRIALGKITDQPCRSLNGCAAAWPSREQ